MLLFSLTYVLRGDVIVLRESVYWEPTVAAETLNASWRYATWRHLRTQNIRVEATFVIDVKNVKGIYSYLWETHLRATERHLPYGFIRCYLEIATQRRWTRLALTPVRQEPLLDFYTPDG